MNKLLIIVFAAVTISCQDEIIDPLVNLTLSKEKVRKELNDLNEFKNNLILSDNGSLGVFEITPLQAISSVANQCLDVIWNVTSESKGQNYCRQQTRARLEDKIKTAISQLDKCVDDEEVSKATKNTDSLLERGKHLLSKLDNIVNDCPYIDQRCDFVIDCPYVDQLCVARILAAVNLSLHSFELSAQELRNTSLGNYSTRKESLKRCFQQVQNAFDSEVSYVKDFVYQCIARPHLREDVEIVI